MKPRKNCLEFGAVMNVLILISNFALLTDAKFSQLVYFEHITKASSKNTIGKPIISNHNKFILSSEPTNGNIYGTPFSLPPIESLPPFPTPERSNPPYCVNPPSPSSTSPTISPPHSITPSSPHGKPSPYNHGPSSPKHSPSPPPQNRPQYAVWCVAKPTVPDFMLQEALDYACGTEADCKEIQPNGKCFQPNTLLSHASYAFNSYWQNRKAGGGSCDFGGAAMLVTADPSFDDCSFIYK